ncbi:MAG: hypothetical protein BEN18_00990 [Epulopiscium sp. Nuni2H_MBin001]|nr:MAG: hypothetical protein BEN18_00990 [Epulopiscium sp. Nuni2H_MBin001]
MIVYILHHDFTVLPNGNIIAIAYDLITPENAKIQYGIVFAQPIADIFTFIFVFGLTEFCKLLLKSSYIFQKLNKSYWIVQIYKRVTDKFVCYLSG